MTVYLTLEQVVTLHDRAMLLLMNGRALNGPDDAVFDLVLHTNCG